MTPKQRIKHISKWIRDYARKAGVDTLVVGISGGIDSVQLSVPCVLKQDSKPLWCKCPFDRIRNWTI
jgi:NH3-dependent NAD+ synthetase